MRNISIYMAADNNLSDYAKKDILEMEKVGSSSSLKAMAQVDFMGKGNTFRYLIEKSSNSLEIVSRNIAPPGFEVNTGDPSAFKEFLNWSLDPNNLNNSSVVLWGHGTGWRPPGRDISIIPSIFSHDNILEELLGYKLKPGRSYGVDFTDAYAALDSLQLKEIFESSIVNGIKLEFTAFDVCLMSSLEVAFQMKKFSKYLISSASEEPSEGWPYKDVFTILSTNQESESVVKQIADNYVQSYLPNIGPQIADRPVTISVVSLHEIDAFLDKFEKLLSVLVKALKKEKYKYHYVISMAKSNSQTFKLTSYIDIQSFISGIQLAIQDSDSVIDIAIINSIQKVQQQHRLMVYKKSLDVEITEHRLLPHGGLTIYFPPRMYEEGHVLRKAYMLMDISREFPAWWEFLETFYGTVS